MSTYFTTYPTRWKGTNGTKVALQEAAATETYRDVERLLDKLCWDHVRKWGGDFEECRSAANVAFVRAYKAHDPTRGQFTTLVYHCVVNALRNETRAKSRREEVEITGTEHPENVMTVETRSCHWIDELSADAQLVARMVLDTPKELIEATLGHRVADIRGGLRFALSQLGWGQDRASDAFNEIKEVLPCVTR